MADGCDKPLPRGRKKWCSRKCGDRQRYKDDPSKQSEASSRWWEKKGWKIHLEKKYGITPKQYEALLEAQGGVCFICLKPPNGKRLAVDHRHDTGEISGLLCAPCNKALGAFEDDPIRLNRAIMYLGSRPAALKTQENNEDSPS